MDMCILKNGTEECKPLVSVAMMSLRSLLENDPVAFYELVMVTRDSTHELFGNVGDKLRDLHLLQANGRPHGSLRNVILSAVSGDGLAMMLGSPMQSVATQ